MLSIETHDAEFDNYIMHAAEIASFRYPEELNISFPIEAGEISNLKADSEMTDNHIRAGHFVIRIGDRYLMEKFPEINNRVLDDLYRYANGLFNQLEVDNKVADRISDFHDMLIIQAARLARDFYEGDLIAHYPDMDLKSLHLNKVSLAHLQAAKMLFKFDPTLIPNTLKDVVHPDVLRQAPERINKALEEFENIPNHSPTQPLF